MSQSRFFVLAVVFLVTVVLDQWTKYLIYSQFRWGESVPVFESFFAITYVRNTGAAFGLLHQAPEAIRLPFFLVVPVVALLVIGYLFYKLKDSQRWVTVALSLIVSGAVGNLIDRSRFGFVVDFLDFYVGSHHWPAFNVADSAIVVGVAMMFLDSFKKPAAASN
ncbi:MAG: signal peptidase II [Bdellovibrionaceae bacterium]|nr:signal peptidase II [Pseudobdellovibrionaceae bacterium]